jgi:hypothetical protein
MRYLQSIFLLFLFFACNENNQAPPYIDSIEEIPVSENYKILNEIPPPTGYLRKESNANSFENWLRKLPLRKDKIVYLYNDKIKPNQSAQFAVVDLSRSKTDLQQCADVVMRLRAEYLFEQKQYDSIRFMDYNKKWYNWSGGNNKERFDHYLQQVFGWCGSASLEKQLKRVTNYDALKTGDVFIKGGFPGHAMIVADMAINLKGEKVFMLIQGYQPAQDIHVVVNPLYHELSPWYKLTSDNEIYTPEWTFYKDQLHKW